MTLFVRCLGEFNGPDYINVAEIVSLSWDAKEVYQVAHLRDGRKVTLLQVIEEATTTTFPAQPGQYLLLAHEYNNEINFWRDPLVAWGVNLLGDFRPMTARGYVEASSNEVARAVLNIDGSVEGEYHDGYPSEDDWRAEVQSDHKKRVALKAVK